MSKIVTAAQAASLIQDGMVVSVSSSSGLGCPDAVLAASIFHFGEFTVGQVKEYLKERGIAVRIV